MAQEVGRYEILFSYWLAKINVMKKCARVLHWRTLKTLGEGEPSTNSPTKIRIAPAYLKFEWYGWTDKRSVSMIPVDLPRKSMIRVGSAEKCYI